MNELAHLFEGGPASTCFAWFVSTRALFRSSRSYSSCSHGLIDFFDRAPNAVALSGFSNEQLSSESLNFGER